jgi:lysozyme
MNSERILQLAYLLVAQWEGFREAPYKDTNGTWTIGFGRTGPDVTGVTAPTTREAEEAWTKARLAWYWKRIDHDVGRDLTENQAAAVLSLTYNIGLGALQRSTLWHFLQEGQPGPAAEQFLRWDKETVDGIKVSSRGLQARRRAERALFLS